MRRINPATIARLRSKKCERWLIRPGSRRSSSLIRNLSSSTIQSFPRSNPSYARYSSRSASANPDEDDNIDEGQETDLLEEEGAPKSPEDHEPQPFEKLVTSVESPIAAEGDLPEELRPLHNHLLTSFLPANQLASTSSNEPSSSKTSRVWRPSMNVAGVWQMAEPSEPENANSTPSERVLALVSPFEGGGHYTRDAVYRVAAEIDADVLRFDLALGIGISGPASPLGRAGVSPPALKRSNNPLLQESPKPPITPPPFATPFGGPEEEADEGDEENFESRNNAIVVTSLPGRPPFNMPSGSGTSVNQSNIRRDWVAFFNHWINRPSSEGRAGKKRIILLESVEAMASTFDEWWPSFQEAVQQRRTSKNSGEANGKSTTSTLTQPTTILFSSSPSLILPHTSPLAASSKEQEAAATSIHPMLQEIADRLGGSIETKVENRDSNPLWWGSEEIDVAGRSSRDGRRLSALLIDNQGALSLLPRFGSSVQTAQRPRHPLLDIIGGNGSKGVTEDTASNSIVWRALPIVPAERDLSRELFERLQTRALISAALACQAVDEFGAVLEDPVEAAQIIRVVATSGKDKVSRYLRILDASDPQLAKLIEGKAFRVSKNGYQNCVRSEAAVRQIAALAIGQKLSTAPQSPVTITWHDIVETTRMEAQTTLQISKRVKSHMPAKRTTKHVSASSDMSQTENAVDPLVAKLKKSKELSAYERRLLGCIVDTSKLSATTFDSVHLPYKTIDGIRTIISLPLLAPEAFRGGVLRDHSTTGALLFGPPGTGKTLLARAVANESGARMLAIQPSDVNDKYFGEGEKLVKAVFSLARRLSPCVVFLDEVDALFGARSSQGVGAGSKAHDQILTEFMQEMDGLSSASANKDKRVVVVGATNRPFDLDDAVLRRLPRRVLVDLPGPADRKAILDILLRDEQLSDDVDIGRIAKDTDGFSGSDLKHLCVSAALAAVKETVHVPWRKNANQGVSTPSVHTSSSESRSGANETVTVPHDISQPSEMMETTASLSDVIRAQLPLASGKPAESPMNAAPDETQTANKTTDEEDSKSAHEVTAQTAAEEASPSEVAPIQRVLSRKHFDIAMTEIRPSSSEEGSLPELRKWAELFGEGGKERGKKKGFGKGFGFGDPTKTGDRHSGVGQVATDE